MPHKLSYSNSIQPSKEETQHTEQADFIIF